MNNTFVGQIDNIYDPEKNVRDSLFEQYEHVIMQTIITTFGFDFIVHDQDGGDVDTINNVRQGVPYKNKENEENYKSRGEYNSKEYHEHASYIATNRANKYAKEAGNLKDAYTGKLFSRFDKADLDHIISAKEIHDDPVRVLSGLNGADLANDRTNLAATNPHTNRSKRADSMTDFLEKHGEEYTANQRRRMLLADHYARKVYYANINRAYYTSSAFFRDATIAAHTRGVEMGIRALCGFVFYEIWLAVKKEIQKTGRKSGEEICKYTGRLLKSIARGIKHGIKNVREKYADLLNTYFDAKVDGFLSSLVIAISNIFVRTSKKTVRLIRQSWASLIGATNIILFNPDCLPFGERLRAAAKIIATGASIVVGTMMGDLIAENIVFPLPILRDIIQTFCGAFFAGIMSCTLLYVLDSSSVVNKLVDALNQIPTTEDIVIYAQTKARLLEEYGAKVMDIDLDTFRKESSFYNDAVACFEQTNDQQELHERLEELFLRKGLPIPKVETIIVGEKPLIFN